MIRTRLAEATDRNALIAFIRDHWSERHVFVRQPDVFDWQYTQPNGRINFILAEDAAGDGMSTVLGVLGFIPMGRFDPTLGDDDLLLALWKVRDDLAPPGLGLRLLKSVQSLLKPRLIGAIGISDMVGPIYRALGYTLDKLHHAALFDPQRTEPFLIAKGVPPLPIVEAGSGGYQLHPWTPDYADLADRLGAAQMPTKSGTYVRERYLDHPWYDYSLYIVERGSLTEAIVVWRSVEAQGARILRIIDIIGDPAWLAYAGPLLLPEVRKAGAEYIDLMQCGVAPQILAAGGWLCPDNHDELILPNYFSPFEARNITISLSWKWFGEVADGSTPLRLYRADSDQDRPNQPTPQRKPCRL